MSFLLQYNFTIGEEIQIVGMIHSLNYRCQASTCYQDALQRLELGRKGSIPPGTPLCPARGWVLDLSTEAPAHTCPKSYMLAHRVILQASPLHCEKKQRVFLKSFRSAPHHWYYVHFYLAVSSMCLFKFLAIWTLLKSQNCNCSDH